MTQWYETYFKKLVAKRNETAASRSEMWVEFYLNKRKTEGLTIEEEVKLINYLQEANP